MFLSKQIYTLLVLFKTIQFRDFDQNHFGAKCNNNTLTLSKGSYEDSEKLRVNYLIFLLPSCVTKIKNKKTSFTYSLDFVDCMIVILIIIIIMFYWK